MRKLSVALVLGLALALALSTAAVASAGDTSAPPSSAPGSLGGGRDGYRECTPYFSEGAGQICTLNRIRIGDLNCSFSDREAHCGGYATTGSFPWGTTGDAHDPYVLISWHPNGSGRLLTLTSYGHQYDGRSPKAKLEGYVAGPGRKEFDIHEAIAGNDEGFPNGDGFYTPNLPGREAGTPGGPLYMKWTAVGLGGGRSEVEIWGFLYLNGR